MVSSGPHFWLHTGLPFFALVGGGAYLLRAFGRFASDTESKRRAALEASRARDAEVLERLGGDVLDREHHIARHQRDRPSLSVVQERQAVASLEAYRLRRADVSTVRPPRGGSAA